MYASGEKRKIGIIGGGPSALFLLKNLLKAGKTDFTVDIFEESDQAGNGMPYSYHGANEEHITNVSGNEIPKLATSFVEWLETVPADRLNKYETDPDSFNEYKVMPRLLFGEYLHAQFYLFVQKAAVSGIKINIHLRTKVTDIMESGDKKAVIVQAGQSKYQFDQVIICTGHTWPLNHEGKIPGYFDSPYPPTKLKMQLNHPIAIKGSSLTAIDAMCTLARSNGHFTRQKNEKISFVTQKGSENFKIIMHSLMGLLPGIRFHLEDPHLSKDDLLTRKEILQHIQQNGGFLSLDYIFEKDFKDSLRDKDQAFYESIKAMTVEEFVAWIMDKRERMDPFTLLRKEYAEAKESIERKKSVYWKEMLAVLSFAMNYPAKHFSAEDMLRLQHVLMPLISIVIAFVPQSSCEEMIALHEAGKLELISVGVDSDADVDAETGIAYHHMDEDGHQHVTHYKTFIDCTGQRHLSIHEFPFKSLVNNKTLSPARIKFKSGDQGMAMYSEGKKEVMRVNDNEFYLSVPGIAITDTFRVVEMNGASNPRIHIMAIPYIGGYNPDYSGLDFCEEASTIIVRDIFADNKS